MMKKKIISAFLCGAMALSLVACGNANGGNGGNNSASNAGNNSSLSVDASISEDWKQYDALIDKIRTGTDFAARVDEMHKAEDILMSTFAVIPIYYYNDVYMKKPDVTGDYNTVYGIKYFKGMTKQGSDTIRINLASEPDFVDPALNSSVDGACLVSNLFSGLYKYNDKSEVEPELADGMPSVSSDGTVYTVKLKPSKWSDGSDLTAKDFIYSWNRVIDEKTAADYAYLFDIVARDADGKLKAVAKDDYTIEVTLTNPCPYFNALLAFPVFYPVPQKAVEAANPDGTTPGKWCQEAGFVSNGAYTMTEWKHNESITFKANPNYWDAKNVKTPNIVFMLSADDTAIYAAYKNNDLDYIDSVPNDEMANLKTSKEFYIDPNLGTYYAAFNVKSDFFKDMTWQQACDFRHAICLLIDRQYIVDTVGQSGQEVADSYIPTGMADGNGGVFKTATTSYYDATEPDVEGAVELLEKAGYKMTKNADGTYTPDKPITLPYILNDNSGHKAVAECIQNDLSQVGINMTISTEDWNVFLQDRKDGNYTFAREGWLADYNDPINMLEMFRSDSGNNDPQFGR